MQYIKTETGLRVMKDRSVALSPRQRSAFILFDGKKTVKEVLQATAAMGVIPADIQFLLDQNLLQDVHAAELAPETATPAQSGTTAESASVPIKAVSSGRSPQQRYEDAYPVATRLTASLGLRGFRLNLAVEEAQNYEQLRALAPRIKELVGPEKYAMLEFALNG